MPHSSQRTLSRHRQAMQHFENHRETFLAELLEFLRIPTVSTDPAHEADIRRGAEWLRDHLTALGFAVEISETPRHPVVFAEHLAAGPTAPTVLIYGHYDVQPPDPLELWDSPPFEPAVRDGKIYARGAVDNKGQIFAHIKGIECHLRGAGDLPVNVKFVIEGEEEIASPNLGPWVAANLDRLACDCIVVSDTGMLGPGRPAITTGLRGMVYFEIELEGPAHDLHSGIGNTLGNPLTELCTMMAAMRDAEGKIAVPGFYDAVRPLTPDEREEWLTLNGSDDLFLKNTGAPATAGEAGFSTLERQWARPSFDLNGISGGYAGPGVKTIIPARASAKFSFRLVPDQSPETIATLVAAHLENICPPSVRIAKLECLTGAHPVLVERDVPAMQAAAKALEIGFGAAPKFVRCGGSVPIMADFDRLLGVPILMLGFSLPDDRGHSPNEKFDLDSFHGGIRTSVALWQYLI